MGKSIFAKTQKSIDNFGSACYNNTVDVPSTYSSLAQSVERVTVNHDVVGSSPTGGAKKKTIRTGWSSSLLLVSLRSKEFAVFRIAKSAAHSRRRQTHWRLLRRRRRVPTGGAKEKTIRTGWSFLCFSYRCAQKSLPVSHREIGKLIGGCCADAVESQQGEPGKSTCFRKCFFSYIRLAASDIAFGSDIRRCRVIFASRV